MKNTVKTALVVIFVAATAFAAGCSDGEPWQVNDPGFNVTPAPQIVRFYADAEKLSAGSSTVIHWEVAGAETVQITAISDSGEPVAFDVNTKELKGDASTPALTSTTHFTLSATAALPVEDSGIVAMKAQEAGEEGEAEGEEGEEAEEAPATASTITQVLTVEVESRMAISASIAADKAVIQPGEQVVIRWNVSPADGVDISVASDSGEAIAATDKCDGDIQTILSQPVSDKVPAVGCAVVAPEAKTVYTVSASESADPTNSAEASASVDVEEIKVEADIKVNGESEAKVTSTESEVDVSWTVTPADAAVTVTASPAVVSCTPELPSGAASEVRSAKCKLSTLPTTFSIQAKVGSMPAVEDKAEVRQGAVTAGIDVRSDEWAFEGETVKVWISLRQGIDPSAIKEVLLTDKIEKVKKVTTFPLTDPVPVVVPADGIQVKMIDSAGEEHDYGTKVRALTTNKAVDGLKVTKLALDPNDPSNYLVGVMMSGYNGGKLRIIKNGNPVDFEFGPEIKRAILGDGAKFLQDGALDKYVTTFPVNAISVRQGDSQKVYMGTTGGVFASSDGGASYSIVGPAMYVSRDGKDYSGSHNSCRGKIQTGVPAGFAGELVAFNQVCDVAVGAGGRLVVATDMGLYTIASIDDYMADKKSSPVKGAGSIVSMKVTDDLECLDADCMNVLAATEIGVIKSTDGGESWAPFGEIGVRAFTLAALGDKVFVGTENGVYSADAASGAWTKLGLEGSKVYSLAIDPNIGPNGTMLIAGTDSGIRVTRNSGQDWSSIDLGGSEESLSVAIASYSGSAGSKKIGVMIGSGTTAHYGSTGITALSVEQGAAKATQSAPAAINAKVGL